MTPPRCPVCKSEHWLREPYRIQAVSASGVVGSCGVSTGYPARKMGRSPARSRPTETLPVAQLANSAPLRTTLGWTQRQLAAHLGVHPVTVARWECGMRRMPEPTARLLRLLARDKKRHPEKPRKPLKS